MAQQKGKNATKAEKLNFLGNKSQNEQMEIRAFSQDGGASSDSTECPTPTEIDPDPDKLTKSHLQQALDALSQKLITTWQHSMASLRKDVQELGKRTTHVESKMEDFASAHNDVATHVEQIEQKLTATELKLTDLEDRARRNNLRLRWIPDLIPENLQTYVRGLLHAYVPEIPADMLLIDRVHWLPRPRFLPETAPRDVLMRIHYHHIKEQILRVSRNKVKPPADFPEIKIFADLSASTLRRRKDFSQIANTLQSNGIRFRWGFPTKMLLTKDGSTQVITSPEDGIRKLRLWALTGKELEPQASPTSHLQLEWSKATPRYKNVMFSPPRKKAP
ncbi:Hypothetical predicted protein [Pelobates cultripes]|uniref:Uncharacterized protein n=1 Tax=Pelobates cultripes TaxID=61616 RepID=A0AAD1SNW3_PELCU|nr:Hypothetical predicted protein [Pelobates cultripes]